MVRSQYQLSPLRLAACDRDHGTQNYYFHEPLQLSRLNLQHEATAKTRSHRGKAISR
jgi:hypothetical protein